MSWLSVSFRRRPGASRPRRRKVATPLVLLALSILWVRALPGQDVGGVPAPAVSDTVPAADSAAVEPVAADVLPADTTATDSTVVDLAADTIPPQQSRPDGLRLGMTTLRYPWVTRLDMVERVYGSELVRYRWTSSREWLAA